MSTKSGAPRGSRGIQNMKHEFLCFPSLLASFLFIFKNKRIVFVGDVLFYGVRPNKPNHAPLDPLQLRNPEEVGE